MKQERYSKIPDALFGLTSIFLNLSFQHCILWCTDAAVAATLHLTWPVMTGHSRGSKISQRKRCKPARKSEERVRKHTGTCQTQLPFTHTRLPLVHLCQSTMWLSDTKDPLYTSRIWWKLAFDRALDSGFVLKYGQLNSIPLINRQTPLQRSNLNKIQISSFLLQLWHWNSCCPKHR